MITFTIPVVVEGKYDKARLSGIVDSTILTTDGFALFNNEEKRSLLRALGKNGVILLCDSDGGGRLIRSHLKGMLDCPVYDLYTPEIAGKEKRKAKASKAGLLGVEGIDSGILTDIFARFAETHPELCGKDGEKTPKTPITKMKLYELGLNGTPDAAQNRAKVAKTLGLPHEMTANAFAEAVNLLSNAEEIEKIVRY